MPINPNLIKHGIDDEEYADACPTLGSFCLAHFSTPEQHNDAVYQADGLFFAVNSSRRFYLREAFCGEFDILTTREDFESRPKLWVLVSLLSEGIHERTPRWRGHKFWGDANSDAEVAQVVIQTSVRGGLNLSEWMGFVLDKRAMKADSAKQRSKRSVN